MSQLGTVGNKSDIYFGWEPDLVVENIAHHQHWMPALY